MSTENESDSGSDTSNTSLVYVSTTKVYRGVNTKATNINIYIQSPIASEIGEQTATDTQPFSLTQIN